MTKQRVGVIGSATVGKTLAAGFAKHGYDVKVGSREPAKLARWAKEAGVGSGTVAEAAAFGGILVLAVKGSGAEAALTLAGASNLDGKLILDTTNPIADTPPQGGVIRYFTTQDDSLMERLQRTFPRGRFVKAWNSVGAALMVDPQLPGGPPTMFIAGDDEAARRETAAILEEFGWEVEDLGVAIAARAIEPLAIPWCIPGFLRNDWVHAFKVLRPG